MNKSKPIRGFSLVELILAVGISAILLMGMSVFFSGAIKSAFDAQERVGATQNQFLATAIVQDKFATLKDILNDGDFPNATRLVALNNTGKMPVSYLGVQNDRLVFKDWLPFNKVMQNGVNHFYGNSGDGKIFYKDPGANTEALTGIPKNFAGFTVQGGNTWIAIPHENKIIQCPGLSVPPDAAGNCNGPTDLVLNNESLNTPIDVTTNGAGLLFISDAGNNRIIQVDASNGDNTVLPIADLNFPTGLAYDSTTNSLFFSDTFNHVVKRIDLDNDEVTVVAGLGDAGTCGGSALYCDLDLPTGLLFGDVGMVGQKALAIADSGNSRVLRVTDVGHPEAVTLNFKTNDVAEAIKKIVVTFPAGVNATSAQLDNQGSLTINTNGTTATSTNSFEYQLFTHLSADTAVTNACGEDVCDQDQIEVANDLLFANGTDIEIGGEAAEVNTPGNPTTLQDPMGSLHSAGDEVVITDVIGAGTNVTFDLSGLVTTRNDSAVITIKAYGLSNEVLFTRYAGLQVGDGEVGNADDQITTVLPNLTFPTLIFPTGTSNHWTADAGSNQILQIGGAGTATLNPYDLGTLTGFDYQSDFILAPNSLSFEKIQGNEILNMAFTVQLDDTNTQAYSLSTHLP